ncbi:hypothetical protein Zm00014a_012740 [Zea mays]|uniref:Uncharacterized protein n=1 Tax=Zea mays TaxID=4577 RepID=A0A3L6DVW6_MAIZE|nr:hypothetical protein Zm00014a_012740 [Zea mays]
MALPVFVVHFVVTGSTQLPETVQP